MALVKIKKHWEGKSKQLKLVVYSPSGRLGFISGESVVDVHGACALMLRDTTSEPRPYAMAEALVGTNLTSFLSGGDRAMSELRRVNDYVRQNEDREIVGVNGERVKFGLDELRLLRPMVDSNVKVMCAGANFADHHAGMMSRKLKREVSVEESLKLIRESTIRGFYKQASNIVGDNDPIPYPSRTNLLDYEGEIALVIGKRGKDIRASNYLDYVFGFTLFSDFSIRDSTLDNDRLNFSLHKNFEASGSMGPCIVTKDEISDPNDLDIITKVNDAVRQNGSTRMMAWKFGELVEFLSSDIVLNPGDIITSGTPAGTAMDSSRDDQGNFRRDRFLKVGDKLQVTSSLIGTLRNQIVAKP